MSRNSNNTTPVFNNVTPHFNNRNTNITPTSNSPIFATNFNNQFNTEPSSLLRTDHISAKPATDFFDAFHDQFNRNSNGSSVKANADPFGLASDSNANLKNTTTPFSAVFGDNLFEDEFAKVTESKPANTFNFAKFDAFNDNNTKPVESANFADFEDSFASAFTTNSVLQEAGKLNVPAGAIHKDKNENMDSKNTRFAADYSQSESFSKDLDEVLKRSLVDQ